jgi:hypothetical protein
VPPLDQPVGLHGYCRDSFAAGFALGRWESFPATVAWGVRTVASAAHVPIREPSYVVGCSVEFWWDSRNVCWRRSWSRSSFESSLPR